MTSSTPPHPVPASAVVCRRRIKRVTPDSEKDERYWERRMKNNESAKRSRENRRQMDFVIRSRVSNLEEENALLREELSLLKAKYNVPKSESLLSQEDQEKWAKLALQKQVLLKLVTKFNEGNMSPQFKSVIDSSSDSCMETNLSNPLETPHMLLRNISDGKAYLECSDEVMEKFNDDRLFHYSQKDLGTPPAAHSPSENIRTYATAFNADESGPADLTMNKRLKRDDDDLRVLSQFTHDRNMEFCDGSSDGSSETDSKNSEDSHAKKASCREAEPECFEQELKLKLQSLSDQILTMQKMMNNTKSS